MSLFCLDIDVICLTAFQICLVALTLIRCQKCQIIGNTEGKDKGRASGRKKGQRKSGQTYIKSANDDTDEEESNRSHRIKKANEKTATNITRLNTSSQVLVDKQSKSITNRTSKMLKSFKKTNQASNSVSEESEYLDEEQKKRQKQLAKIIQNFRSQRIKDYESDQEGENNEERNEQFEVQEQDYEMTGQFNNTKMHSNFKNELSLNLEQVDRFSPFTMSNNQSTQRKQNSLFDSRLIGDSSNKKLKNHQDFHDTEQLSSIRERINEGMEETNTFRNPSEKEKVQPIIKNKPLFQAGSQEGIDSLIEEEIKIHQQAKPVFEVNNSVQSFNEEKVEDRLGAEFGDATQKTLSQNEVFVNKDQRMFSQIGYSLPTQHLQQETQFSQTREFIDFKEDNQENLIASENKQQEGTENPYQDQPRKSVEEVKSSKSNRSGGHQDKAVNQQDQLNVRPQTIEDEDNPYPGIDGSVKPNFQSLSQQDEKSKAKQQNAKQEKLKVESIQGPDQPFYKQPMNNDSSEGEEEDKEEERDQINPNDVKPKRNILFSDKSESSIEDMMEDTPSNYNVPNGRLDEESKGLRSILYKSIVKKYMYDSALGKKLHDSQKEDQEATSITTKLRASLDRQKMLSNNEEKQFVKQMVNEQERNLAQAIISDRPLVNQRLTRKSSQAEVEAQFKEEGEIVIKERKNRNKTPMRI